jgi:glutamate--cysteine ligase
MKQEDLMGLELSTQILINEAINREIEVELIDKNENFIRLRKGNHVEYIKQATKTSADTYISSLIMENKVVTKLVLEENEINVPKGISVESVEEAEKHIEMFLNRDIVVKPKSTNFGEGVFILKNIQSAHILTDAVEHALRYDDSVLIEEFASGKEYRFLVIGNEVPAILHRVPANVVGDGKHSIKELVDIKNQDPLRGKGYVTPLEKINLSKVEEDYLALGERHFQTIPKENEIVYLRENSNISTGGDSIDFTDDILDEYKQIAIKAAKSVGAKICGADIIIKNINEKPNASNYSIIELNFNPALHIHDFPYQGQNRHVEKKVLDLLGY